MKIPGFEILDLFSENYKFIIYKAFDQRFGRKVLIKTISQKKTDVQEIYRDFRISNFIKGSKTQNPLELIRHEDVPVLILEDFNSVPLSKLFPNGVDSVHKFFEIALEISFALQEIHERRILHKSLYPENIWIQADTGIVRIADFSSSTFSGKDISPSNTPILPLEVISYIAPELTGRLSRVLDLRTDFYSLGIVFYEMATGTVPFVSKDRNEILHSHLTKIPAPIHTIRNDFPISISIIVSKLLEKGLDLRYASIQGLIYDLEICFKDFQNGKINSEFIPCSKDNPEIILDSSNLYGREKEILVLQSSLDKTSQGETRVVFITGVSGSGKSALVKSFLKSISNIFVQGKFSQYETSMPFGGLIHSLQDLVSILLSKDEKEIQEFKELIYEHIGDNGKILLNQFPELEFILGPQPELSRLPPDENQNRFYHTLSNFIKVLTKISRPFVLYLDDLQWADSASLRFIETILVHSEIKNLLCILSFRSEEVGPSNTFSSVLKKIENSKAKINRINVGLLDEKNVYRLIQDLFPGWEEQSKFATSIFLKKTSGNPLAIIQLLEICQKKRLITYQFKSKLWKWDLEKIERLSISDNVVDLLCARIEALSPELQELLGVCSCLGKKFTLEFLSKLSLFNTTKLEKLLWFAVKEGFLNIFFSENHFLFEEKLFSERIFSFSHDKIQQVIYDLLEESKRKKIHKHIGMTLLTIYGLRSKDKILFQIVQHLNHTIDTLEEESIKNDLTILNYKAGLQAKNSGSYESSLQYLNFALNFLNKEASLENFELYVDVILEIAETEYLLSNYERVESFLRLLENKNITNLQYVRKETILVRLYSKMNKIEDAVLAGLRGMRRFKIYIPSFYCRIVLALFKELLISIILSIKKSDLELICVKENSEPEYEALIDLFAELGPSAFTYNQNLFALIVLKMFNVSLTKGVSRSSAIVYSGYGMIVNQVLRDLNQAVRYSKLAMDLNKKIPFDLVKWKVKYVYSAYICHWVRHISFDIGLLDEVHNGALQNGDVFFAGFSLQAKIQKKIFASYSINELLTDIDNAEKYFKITRDDFASVISKSSHQFIRALAGKTSSCDSLEDSEFRYQDFENKIIKDKNYTALSYYYHDLTKLYYFSGKYQKAILYATKCEKLIRNAFGLIPFAEYWFYYGIVILANFHKFNFFQRIKYLKKLNIILSYFKRWSRDCPENFMGLLELLNAEKKRIRGKVYDTIVGYERAIKLFQESGFISFQALSSEMAAVFHYKLGNFSLGNHYLGYAINLYSKWGALSKVSDLKSRFSNRLHLCFLNENGEKKSLAQDLVLDWEIILKAYNVISKEIVLDNLLKKLMQITMQTAGATKAVYFNLYDKNPMVYLIGQNEKTGIKIEKFPELDKPQYPVSYLNYVFRTGKLISTFDFSAIKDFSDQYIKEKNPQSMICIPLTHIGKLKGILYLENEFVKGMFTESNIQILKLIVGQAAIFIENANLYAELEEKVKQRTSELDNTIHLLRKDLLYAQKIQDKILPKPESTLGGIDIFTKYVPMMYVGGDIYDYEEISTGKVRIFLADATGHGVQAALVTMLIKSEYESLKYLNTSPGGLITELNRTIIAKYKTLKFFFSCLVVDVDTKKGTLYYSAAGHPDQFYLSGSTITKLTRCGPIIGILESKEYDSHFLKILKGDKLFFFSDGMIEGCNPFKETFGEDRLLKLILDHSSKPISEIVSLVFSDLQTFLSGKEVADDITFLSAEVL
ncbi:stage II sporulation protein E [Leptospira kirschneri str. 200803703]|uniref:trifunctional serine/threonine-protein kinase/ATP-binding protein/SpoIIE family protein phosphatase n=1 Tax=Leptospira kirschneri TaxID=29507 RepID=UPI0002BD6550|nr:trifunctional serine/threonine-protein kinase/ATP-binding protein/SpoIIE family protein phosphatase [Leptospira kirschneri]EMO66572.1 stage II sporulation protein E [Leptospira kirschneri str. 200803703]